MKVNIEIALLFKTDLFVLINFFRIKKLIIVIINNNITVQIKLSFIISFAMFFARSSERVATIMKKDKFERKIKYPIVKKIENIIKIIPIFLFIKLVQFF